MCKMHWIKVPPSIQRAVWKHYRPGQCDDKEVSVAWLEAADAAIGYIARLEGKPATPAMDAALDAFIPAGDPRLASFTEAKAAGADCDNCPLGGKRKVDAFSEKLGPVPASGSEKPRLVILGEGPGYSEVLQGRGFVGKSGKLLDDALQDASFDRSEAWITNTTLCRPEEDWQKAPAQVCCSGRLSRELQAIDASIPILALGSFAMKSCLGIASILRSRGFVWRAPVIDEKKLKAAVKAIDKARARLEKASLRDASRRANAKAGGRKIRAGFDLLRAREAVEKARVTEKLLRARAPLAGRTIIPTVHPSFILRGADGWRPVLAQDVERAARIAQHGVASLTLLDEQPYTTASSAKQLERALRKMGGVVAVDIESDTAAATTCQIYCVGISDADPNGDPKDWSTVVAYPWTRSMAKVLAKALKKRRVITHNGPAFDEIRLAKEGVPFAGGNDDTLIAHHAFAGHMPQRLGHVATVYCDVGPWKVKNVGKGAAEEKGASPWEVGGETLTKYNCLQTGTQVVLADGSRLAIEKIVRERLTPSVLSLGRDGLEPKRVVGWVKQEVEGQRWIAMKLAGTKADERLVATPDHRIYTERGVVELQHVTTDDSVATEERKLSEEQFSAILGTVLGDSSLFTSPAYRGLPIAPVYYLNGSHSEASEFAPAKVQALPLLTVGGCYSSSYNGSLQRRFRSRNTPQLVEVRKLTYDLDGVRRIRKEALDRLGPVGWAWWFLDDGCRQNNKLGKDSIHLAVHRYPRGDQEMLADRIRQDFGPCSIQQGSIYFSPSASAAFCDYISPYVFPAARYKLSRQDEWSAWIGRPLKTTNAPFYARVERIWPFTPPTPVKRRTRYCLTVEDNHNFFTTSGLVHNCADVVVDCFLWHSMQGDLYAKTGDAEEQRLFAPNDACIERRVYEHDMKLAALCQKMQLAGIRVDNDRRKELARKLKFRAAGLLGEMRSVVGSSNFSPKRTVDIRAALYGRFKIPVRESTATGLAATGKKVLEALRGRDTRAGKLADLIMRWRSADKTRATFLNSIQVDLDGRVHPSWRSFGAVTGRLSCRNPNLMNLPRYGKDPELEDRVREIYIASKGCTLLYFDLAQSEMRAGAYLSGDKRFIESCESGDVHSANAAILFPEAAELIRTDPKGKGKRFRDITKNAGFGILYLAEVLTIYTHLLANGFTEMTLESVEAMFDHIHMMYRGYYQWAQNNIDECQRKGYLRTALLGRMRWFGHYPKPTEVANFRVQSFIADLMNARLIELDSKMPAGARLVAQIHDAAIYEVRKTDLRRAAATLQEVWERPIVIPHNGLSFVMPIDRKEAERWSDFG
jgi:uracil-DNA glycosylase family 4